MSEDWLVTSDRSVHVPDLLQALEPWAQSVVLRATEDESCTVIADVCDHAVAWVTPSVPVRDVDPIATTYDLPMLNVEHRWWTEVICPAGPCGVLDSRFTTAALARSLASSVDGMAVCLSTAPMRQSDRRQADPRAGQDRACDVLTDQVAIFVQSRRTLALTAWITVALAWAIERGRMPVLLTPAEARLSPVLQHIAHRGGCWWIRRGRDGMTNGLTGAPVTWDGNTFIDSGSATPEPPESDDWQVVLACDAHHLSAESTSIGQLSAFVHAACGLPPIRSWGLTEPTDRAWDASDIATQARAASPEVFRFLFRSTTTQGLGSVVPEPIGVREEVMVHVQTPELLPAQTDLGRLGERLLQAGCDVAIVSYQPVAPDATGPSLGPGAVMPGLIAYRPDRFDGLAPHCLDLDPVPGVEALTNDAGVAICFRSPPVSTDNSQGELLNAWWRCLRALDEADGLRAVQRPQGLPVTSGASTAAAIDAEI